MTVTAGPAASQTAALATGAVLLLVAGVLADPGGRVLSWPAAGLLLALAARDVALGPALRADGTGLVVVAGLRRHVVPWSAVERLRLVTDRRTPLLELDSGEHLLLLSRWRLGRAPAQVLDDLGPLAPPALGLSP